MLAPNDYEKILILLADDNRRLTAILNAQGKEIQALWDDFYGHK